MATAVVTARSVSPSHDPPRQGLVPQQLTTASTPPHLISHPSSSSFSSSSHNNNNSLEDLNPYHSFASGIQQQEVHIVKVKGDTVHVVPGPQRESLFNKALSVLPNLGSAADLPLSPAGPPPPSPPASVDRLPLSESPQGLSVPLPLPPTKVGSTRGETASVTFEEPPPEALHPARLQSPSASGMASGSSSAGVLFRSVTGESRTSSGSTRPASSRLRASTTDDFSFAAPHSSTDTPVTEERMSMSTSASSGKGTSHISADGFLHPPQPHRPARRNTTGSAMPWQPLTAGAGGSLAEEGAGGDGELATDIQARAEQIRRERQSKRAKALQQAEKALTRSGSKSTVKETEDGGPLVGNLIGEDHVNYVLMYNMLTGIRIAVSRCQAKIKRPLTDEDFAARHKYSFDIVGNELTPSAKYDFKFKDYAPFVFRELREDMFHLDPSDYLMSLTSKYILSELGSPGKSGSFFYFSRDYRFIIKTIHHSEHKFLRSIIKQYYQHVKENPHTLISRFYGLHRVKLPRGRKIHFVIMNNLFPPHKDIHETYDLKGSTVGREYPEDRARENPRAVLKDLNWINRGKELELGPEKRALLTEQLRRDAELLKRIYVMDYSLLVGIHNVQRGNRDNVRRNTLKVFSPDMPPPIRRNPTQKAGPSSPEAIAMRRAMRESDPKKLEESALADLAPTADTGDRAHFVFYRDDGGMRATGEANEDLDKIYYLGVIDILTPYNTLKKLEHVWKGFKDDIHKISPVPPPEYSDRFFRFMKAVMRGGEGGEAFK